MTVLAHASKSSTIAQSDDRSRVAMVNPDDGSLSVFQTSDNSRTAKVATGKNLVERRDRREQHDRVRRESRGRNGGARDRNRWRHAESVDATVDVGAEPVALALSPTGAKLFVAEMAESRVTIIDTKTMEVLESIDVDRPRALTITNNLDKNDDDETLVVTQFFGVATPGGEAEDDGRTGKVRLYSLADLYDVSLVEPRADRQRLPQGRRRRQPHRARVAEPAQRRRGRERPRVRDEHGGVAGRPGALRQQRVPGRPRR